jgi:3-hydroxyacyl-[acyl-carrier-protein] dehydratase
MILLGDFYTILNEVIDANTIKAILKLNPEHEIFKGHFPGQPVVPGVCMLQMVKELMETVVDKAMMLSKGNELKFLAVIDPRQYNLINAEVNYTIEAGSAFNINARLFYNETTFFKCKGIFIAE